MRLDEEPDELVGQKAGKSFAADVLEGNFLEAFEGDRMNDDLGELDERLPGFPAHTFTAGLKMFSGFEVNPIEPAGHVLRLSEDLRLGKREGDIPHGQFFPWALPRSETNGFCIGGTGSPRA